MIVERMGIEVAHYDEETGELFVTDELIEIVKGVNLRVGGEREDGTLWSGVEPIKPGEPKFEIALAEYAESRGYTVREG